MPKKVRKTNKLPSADDIVATAFFPASKIPLSEAAWESIRNASNITFGDAKHSLFSIPKVLNVLDTKRDEEVLIKIMDKFGNILIDLES